MAKLCRWPASFPPIAKRPVPIAPLTRRYRDQGFGAFYPTRLRWRSCRQCIADGSICNDAILALTAGTGSRRGCFPGRGESCTGGQCRCRCRPPGGHAVFEGNVGLTGRLLVHLIITRFGCCCCRASEMLASIVTVPSRDRLRTRGNHPSLNAPLACVYSNT